MKKYDFLLAFGCSYTDGGGLNSQNFHRYLKGNHNYSKSAEPLLDEHLEYARLHSYSGYLAKKLDCDFQKFGIGGGSNEWIFQTAFDTLQEYKNKGNILALIQTTHLHRRLIQLPKFNKSINVNQVDNLKAFDLIEDQEALKNYYNLFVAYFYDMNYEFQKVLFQIELFRKYFKDTNIDLGFLIFEKPQNDIDYPTNKNDIIQSGYLDFNKFLKFEKLTISDLPNFPYYDTHASPIGNSAIADIIYKQLPGFYND